MNINESIDSIERDIEMQTRRLQLFRMLSVVFEGFEFPSDIYTYANRRYDGSISLEFSPNGENKDFRPFIHALAQKFHITLEKARDYDSESLAYAAQFEMQFEGELRIVHLKVRGVVPSSCRIEETIEQLSEDEIQAARDAVPTTRTTRKIVCD